MRIAIWETKQFKVFAIKRKQVHKLEHNEMLLPRAHQTVYWDYILWWGDKNEEKIYVGGYGYLPKCYWAYIQERGGFNGMCINDTKIDDFEGEERILRHIGFEHRRYKKEIIDLFKEYNWRDYQIKFAVWGFLAKDYTEREVFNAIGDVPLFISDIVESDNWYIDKDYDEVVKQLIGKQIIDNRNLARGEVTYNCLEHYMKSPLFQQLSYFEKKFIIRQYEGKMKKKGLGWILDNEEYKRIIKA